MYNPSYLIKSRHDIYYFRYPLPIKSSRQNSRICISLGTRCPREALQQIVEKFEKILEVQANSLEKLVGERTEEQGQRVSKKAR